MYLEDVRDMVEKVEEAKGDDEGAHIALDYLFKEVLTAIATGQCQDAPPEDFAALALEADKIEFTRWYA